MDGGAIYVINTRVFEAKNLNIKKCTAEQNGGGIYFSQVYNVEIIDSVIEKNKAE